MARVLIIDDNPSVGAILDILLKKKGHSVTCARTAEEGIRLFSEISPDLVITDVHMPVTPGFEVCRTIKKQKPGIPVLMVTGCLTKDVLKLAAECGAAEVVKKPFELPELTATVSRLLALRTGAGTSCGLPLGSPALEPPALGAEAVG